MVNDSWTVLLGDQCFLTKLYQQKFEHIRSLQSEDWLYKENKM